MPGYHSIRTSARQLADKSSTDEVKAIIELIVKLVDECEKTERTAQAANRNDQSRRK
jgi:hypothetical protein